MAQHEQKEDKDIPLAIVKGMTESFSGAEAQNTGPTMPCGSIYHHLHRKELNRP
jgi:hypothetical protein